MYTICCLINETKKMKKEMYVYWFVVSYFFLNIFSFVFVTVICVSVSLCMCVVLYCCFSLFFFGLVWCTGTLVILRTIVKSLDNRPFCLCSVLINKYYFDLKTKLSERKRIYKVLFNLSFLEADCRI